ncbi:MAG: hypothetical protein ILO34_03040 [Kiritimatiellae bacterium]|nr:hypothetical protein [Kiritimatiellia bacterium]
MDALKLAKVLVVLFICVAVALVGCEDSPNGRINNVRYYAYDQAYSCQSGTQKGAKAVAVSDGTVDAAAFVKGLPDGVYWIVGENAEKGELADSVLVGSNGWEKDGAVETRGNFLMGLADQPRNSNDERSYVCWLSEYSTIEISGRCYSFKLTSPYDCEADACLHSCAISSCEFSLPVGVTDSSDVSAAVSCLREWKTFQKFGIYVESDSVVVSVTDSIVSIVVPNVTVTWTKRPGL